MLNCVALFSHRLNTHKHTGCYTICKPRHPGKLIGLNMAPLRGATRSGHFDRLTAHQHQRRSCCCQRDGVLLTSGTAIDGGKGVLRAVTLIENSHLSKAHTLTHEHIAFPRPLRGGGNASLFRYSFPSRSLAREDNHYFIHGQPSYEVFARTTRSLRCSVV